MVCSLSPSEGAARAQEIRGLARSALVARERDGDRVVLRFATQPGVREAVADLARRERDCCGFLDFSVRVDECEVTLAIAAAPADRAAIDVFYELASPGS